MTRDILCYLCYVCIVLISYIPSTALTTTSPDLPPYYAPRTQHVLDKMISLAPPFPEHFSDDPPSDTDVAFQNVDKDEKRDFLGRKIKRDAMGCRYGKVLDIDIEEDTLEKRGTASLAMRERLMEKAKRDDDLYFAMTELLRRIEIGHEIGTNDLPAQLRDEFERGIADGSLAGFLRSCEAWWEMPPFVLDSGKHPAQPPSGSGLPRSDYESVSMLTFNGGGNEQYLWAQDVREVSSPAASFCAQHDGLGMFTLESYENNHAVEQVAEGGGWVGKGKGRRGKPS